MKEKIFNNLSLKILSVLFAIVLWMVIINIYDPTTSKMLSSVTVHLINTDSLTDKDYTYEVVDGSKISVYISGPSSIVTDISSSDIYATADLSKISAFANYVDIDVKVIKNGREITNVDVSPRTTAVILNIENRVTKDFPITPEITGEVANGYVLSDVVLGDSTVRVTGPASRIESISKVTGVYNVSDATTDISSVATVTLYDENGETIDQDGLILSSSEVGITAKVGASKKVSIKYGGLSGKPASGFMVMKVELSIDTVELTGDAKELNKISDITIPSNKLNIEGISEDKTFVINLLEFVSSGVNTSVSEVYVTVKVVHSSSKHMNINMSEVKAVNLTTGKMATFITTGFIPIVVTGKTDNIDSLTSDQISAYVDLSGLEEGNHKVVLKFTLPEGYTIKEEYYVDVEISTNQS